MPDAPPWDPKDLEVSVDDDLLAAAVAAVEKRLAPKPEPEPDPEESAAFAADLIVDEDEIVFSTEDDDEGDETADEDIVLADDVDDEAPGGVDDDPATLREMLAAEGEQLAAALDQIAALEQALADADEQLEQETQDKRRATAIARRLKERVERSELLLANARKKLGASNTRIEELEGVISVRQQDVERMKERHRRQLDDARQRGQGKTFEAMLPVLDHLEMALAHATAEPEKLAEGIGMIADQFVRALASRGCTRVEAAPGTPFDPEVHEAVQRVETADAPAGTVLHEIRGGYVLDGRLLRAARVTVAAAPAPLEPDEEPASTPAEGLHTAGSAEE